jgi:hypothetical protein
MGTEPTIEFEVKKYYTPKEVDDNLVDMHIPRKEGNISYRTFRKPRDEGTRYYFLPTTIRLYWLWQIENEIIEFLSRAREECSYESIGESGKRVLSDGRKQIGPYSERSLSYVDTYKGFERFEGREEIREDGKLVWIREYEGGIIDEQHKEKETALRLYDVLKQALRQFPKDKPFKRGPDYLNLNGYEYSDQCVGNMGTFNGTERIMHEGKKVYIFRYSGGIQSALTELYQC